MSFTPERADRYEPLDEETTQRWMRFGSSGTTTYPMLLGLIVEDIRRDYCRMRLPFRDELLQAAGFMHGGAFASLLDHVMVPAVGAILEPGTNYSTVDMHVQYIRGIVGGDKAQDAIAEGWITRRGRRTVFCEAEAYGATTGDLLAKSVLTYAISPPRT
ncbi:PaaI family thioesterase [Ilumatobacter nonamiensis]|uniref:PaaI family thioesterase n=1 Tax=Ilumatobacter nonamiensis TaxID=467093 RepID=UPI0003463CB4|nr:PaaI family thioesterase [Ilumatobacter nonamiensis]